MKRISFCEDWSFRREGGAPTAVCLPHDATLGQRRRADAPSGTAGAFFPGGRYEYEKTFYAPAEWEGQEILLEFEGVYPSARVWLNEVEVGGCAYGYSQFRVPLSGLACGAENRVRVEADNSELPDSRWYAGAGIYRPVWLLTGNREHIVPGGVRVTTLSCEPAKIRVEVAHTLSQTETPAGERIQIEIFYGEAKVAEGQGENVSIPIPDAHLWDADAPALYRCAVTLRRGESVLDTESVTFGIRKLEWSPEGLRVNGRTVLLKGGCIHHDNGILGAASYGRSEWRRIRKLKENGFNAVRAAHNPLCREALEACDALGMYVMDELWDMWDKQKSPYDYARRFLQGYEYDIRAIVEKDYNHPCVILYSVGNEVTEPAKPEGVELAADIIRKLKEKDRTRPVTAGINLTLLLMAAMEKNQPAGGGTGAASGAEKMDSTAFNQMVSEMGQHMLRAAAREEADEVSSPVLELLDIAGYNYASTRYEKEGELHPERIVVGSETFAHELAKVWPLVEKYPYVIGDFMWTAWDYLGEVGIGGWSYDEEDKGFKKSYPWLLADTGAFDILGNETAEAGMAAVIWGARGTPYIGVRPVNHQGKVPCQAMWRGTNALPCWSYRGCGGKEAHVEVYSRAYEVELLVNGTSVGRERVQDYKAEFHTLYEPGEIRAVAYSEDGTAQSESSLRSAEGRTGIRVSPEEDVKRGDIFYVDISLVGENGETECNQDTALRVSVEGGELLGFGSARPKTEESFRDGEYRTYYGRSQAVIRAVAEQVTILVRGDGLETVRAQVAAGVQ